ncbi:MAG: GC-type dockerin domain-anchored protein [Phycisphaerales bacterium JB052]
MKTKILNTMLVSAIASAASAQTVTVLPNMYYVSDFSYDGTYAVGNLAGPYETFRWSAETGPELLGRATLPTLGIAAGSPDISHDGTRISASITSSDGTLMTQGIWDLYDGWTSLENPFAADASITDGSIASAWGLSGDGSTLTGFYWYTGGRAHPSKWKTETGVTPLEVTAGLSARVNAASFDGSVVVGWESTPMGPWQPTVWRDGVKMRIAESPGGSTAEDVSSDGNFVVGSSFEPDTQNRSPAIWRWDGNSYIEQRLGLLPGTPAFSGFGIARGLSDDGSIVVGTNFYSINPGGSADGFVWSEATGLMNAMDYFASIGIDLSTIIDLRAVDAISPDGSTFAATGFELKTGELRTVIIQTSSACPADMNGDGVLDFFDVSAFIAALTAQDTAADLNNDGLYNFFDVSAFLSAFAAGCP